MFYCLLTLKYWKLFSIATMLCNGVSFSRSLHFRHTQLLRNDSPWPGGLAASLNQTNGRGLQSPLYPHKGVRLVVI